MSSTNHTLIETLAADRDGMVDLTRDLIAIPTHSTFSRRGSRRSASTTRASKAIAS
jgi:hypothetical protein